MISSVPILMNNDNILSSAEIGCSNFMYTSKYLLQSTVFSYVYTRMMHTYIIMCHMNAYILSHTFEHEVFCIIWVVLYDCVTKKQISIELTNLKFNFVFWMT